MGLGAPLPASLVGVVGVAVVAAVHPKMRSDTVKVIINKLINFK